MGWFCRTSCPAPVRSPTPPSRCGKLAPRSRNAFIHFLHEFKQNPDYKNVALTEITMDAAYYWNKMSLHEKAVYLQAAHNTNYVYHSRNRRQNNIMRYVRKSLEHPHKVNVRYLASAVKQMRLWKYETMRKVFGRQRRRT